MRPATKPTALFLIIMLLVLPSACTNSQPVEIVAKSPTEHVPTTTTATLSASPSDNTPISVDTPTIKSPITIAPTNTATLSPTNRPDPTSTPTAEPFSPWHGHLAFASQLNDTNGDGQLGFEDDVHIFSLDISSEKLTQITYGNQRDIDPAWSPSGNKIAFVSNRSGNFDLFTVSADGSTLHQLTNTLENEITPAWSPDETKIVYVRVTTLESGERERKLYLLTIADDLHQELSVGPGNIFSPHWSPDGRYLLFEREDEIEQDNILSRVKNIYFWDTVTNSLIKLDLDNSIFQDLDLRNPKWLPTNEYRLSISIQKRLSDVPTDQVRVYDLEWDNGVPILHERLILYDAPEPYTWGPNGEWYVALTHNGFEGIDRYDLISHPIDYAKKTLMIDTYNLLVNDDIVAEGIYFYSSPVWMP